MTIAATEPDSDTPVRPPVPEVGQVVRVRGSTWSVGDVAVQGLPRSPADESAPELAHVVTLQSLEDDRLGEELAVVWELEVGNSLAPEKGLPEAIDPERFDDPNTLAAFIDAVRWGAVTSADPNSYQSPFRSGATVEAYQLEPLRRALASPRTNLLLADDVGLGKTIEAGLVIQELLLRHRARSVIIVCPPSLSLKWQDEMREKFGLEFTIVNSQLMAELRRSHGLNANPFRLFPRVIVSMAWLPSIRAQRLLRGAYAGLGARGSAKRFAFDILVVDEAHHAAPAGPTASAGGKAYAVDSQRTIALRELANVCEHRLFLSATPHNGYQESFTALLEMVDSRRFTRGARLDPQALRDVTVRRLKAELPDKGFQPRQLKLLPFTPNDDEQEAFETLDRILRESAKLNGRNSSAGLLAMLLKKRFLSSPWSFSLTLGLYQSAAAGRPIPLEADEDALYIETLGSDQSDEEEGLTEQPEFRALRRAKASNPLVAAKPGEIERLIAWGAGYEHRPEARLKALMSFLDSVCRIGKHWSNERVVVFSEYAATLEWLRNVLEANQYKGRLAVIQGSTPAEERELIRARFSEDPAKDPVRVLLATDSAGEGIDLQAHCHRLVNFDIPFNPSRLEQRIGRIDRYGQAEPPEIYHFAPVAAASTYAADLDFMRRVAEKVDTVVLDLGSVNQVIDADIQARFNPARPGKSRVKAQDSDGAAIISRTLAGGIELNRQLTELSATYGERKERMHLTPFNARRVLDTALANSGQASLIEIDDEESEAPVYRLPADLSPAWQLATRGLDTRLAPGEPRPVTFDDNAARGRSDLVHVHLGHALMQKASRQLRSALFTSSSLNRVTAVVVEGLPESCVAAVSRLVLVGRGGLRLHEEVFLTGIRLRGQAMAEAKVEQLLDDALDAPNLELAPEHVRVALAASWNAEGNRMRGRLLDAIANRAASNQHAVTAQLAKRREKDRSRATGIFAAFRANLIESRDALADAIRTDAEALFSDDQQAQRRRDLLAMEQRLDSLGEEERREVHAIEQRYADIRPHIMEAAVVFALTPADAEAMA